MNEIPVITSILQLLAGAIRLSTPLIFAALGGMMSERSGVINIALEGMMLIGAFFAAICALATGSAWAGAGGAALAGTAIAAIYAVFVIRLRANQIVAGTAINMLAAGTAPFLCKILYGTSGATPGIPLARFLYAPVIIAWAAAILLHLWLHYTPGGMWVRFAGEHPEALEAAGIRSSRVRWASVLMSGALAGLGGAGLSIMLSSSFTRNMTAGRGFMALAALIFGKWKPVPTAFACLLFGITDAMQMRLQGVHLFGAGPIPVQFIQILPYVITVLVLAGFVGSSRAPKALGRH